MLRRGHCREGVSRPDSSFQFDLLLWPHAALHPDRMRISGVLRLLALILALVTTWLFIHSYMSFNIKNIRLPRWLGGSTSKETKVVKTKCGLSKSCPANFFAFKIISGAANVVGPSLCFEDHMIMSAVKNNVGRGLNIALVNGTTGMVMRQSIFDMYSGDVNHLVKFLKGISEGTLVLVASYDDPGTKMNDEIRQLFSKLGSSHASNLGFRDSWVFLGAKDLKNKSPFEQFLKNNPETNKYEGWPELLELEGCVPSKIA
ncbi:protein FAM3D isoform X3 [Nycticebus coucang]|uniref:protein FAM3D isoform X3 n=2 Tax=Nycticebus coucang TaxID=9470 RepID=UPI00234E1A43|nr:protein FAM3D isoform X3 [Nycticebus coucang]